MNKNRKNILTSGVRLEKTLLLLFLCLSLGAQAQKIHIKTGIEVLKSQNFRCLEGKRVGLITNPTGVDNELRSTIDILHEAPNVNLVALYGPEHGVRGDVHAGDHVSDQRDPATGLPVYSLYGKTRKGYGSRCRKRQGAYRAGPPQPAGRTESRRQPDGG